MRRRFRSLAAALPAVVLSAALTTAAPAAAAEYGSVTGTFCGARGTFETYVGVPEINYIVDNEGRADGTNNGGCFGISPGQHIFWTPRSSPGWRLMPGNGVAVKVGLTYLGHACPPGPYSCLAYAAPTVSVSTAGGHLYGQTWDPFAHAWGGHWYPV